MNDYLFRADRPIGTYRKSDAGFIACVILLFGIGIFALSISSQDYAERMFGSPFYFVKRQLISAALGLCMFIVFSALSMKAIRALLPIVVLGTLVLCLLTFMPGIAVERNGAHRWIRMPFSFTLQPSEFAKFAVVLFLANLFDKFERTENPDEKSMLPAIVGLALFSFIVALQRDFSTAVLIFVIGIAMFFASGAKLLWLFPAILLIIPTVLLLISLEPYRIERIVAFLRPDENAHTYNYQSIAARRAISAGSVWGEGIGSGIRWLSRIPEVQADYIFAGWAEAMGFVGVLIYFALLSAFAFRGYFSSFTCTDRFAAYASFGCVTVIVGQSLVNVAVVCGLLPTTGIPLPFFSLGGSSIIVTLAMCGFVVNASRRKYEGADGADGDFNNLENLTYEGDLYE